MKKILIIGIVLLTFSVVQAQESIDVGIWGGVGTSLGDMTEVYLDRSLEDNYGAFIRYNINSRVAVRMQFITGKIKGEGKFDSHDWYFESKDVTSFSVMAEINFLRYILGQKETPYATYLMGGVGIGRYPYNLNADLKSRLKSVVSYDVNAVPSETESLTSFHIPIGFGYKHNIGKRVGVGVELLINRYFSDKLDDLDDPRRSTNSGTYTDSWHNNDYTVYMGFNLTYRIDLRKQPCPVYEYE